MQTTVLILFSYYIYRMELTLGFIQFNHSRIAWQGDVLCDILNKLENKKTKSRRASNLFFARCADDHETSDRKVLISYLWLWHLVLQITSSSIPSRENIQNFLRGAKRYGVRGRVWGNDCFCIGVVLSRLLMFSLNIRDSSVFQTTACLSPMTWSSAGTTGR